MDARALAAEKLDHNTIYNFRTLGYPPKYLLPSQAFDPLTVTVPGIRPFSFSTFPYLSQRQGHHAHTLITFDTNPDKLTD
jgi:hypothetical protein